MVLEVPFDGVGAGVQASGGEFLAEFDDQVDGLGGGRGRDAVRASRVWFEGGVALGLVADEELEEPGLRDAVLGGDIADGAVFDHHGGDQQSVECHAPDAGGAIASSPG